MTYQTAHFGAMAVDEQSIEFPAGLPGFEDCRRFVLLPHPEQPALTFLQSLERPDLCFLALPALNLRPDYKLAMTEEYIELLGASADADMLALAILSLEEGQPPTANLLAPVVVHTGTRRGVQAIRPDTEYACREPLFLAEALCS